MQRFLIILLLLLAGWLPAAAEPAPSPMKSLSLPQLEQRLADIDSELKGLARFTPRSGVGSLGYRSNTSAKPDTRESIRIELGEETTIDEVVLVPALFRDSETGFRSGGFPVDFRILVGTGDSSRVVASFSKKDQLLPRIAPLAVPFEPTEASWITIEATTLSAAPYSTTDHTLQFSEILVFSGMTNVALPEQRTIKPTRGARVKGNLTDGFTPFIMNAAQGHSSQSKPIRIQTHDSPLTLTIDLKASQAVHQINLHTADMVLTIPMYQFSCSAVPRHIRVTGANHLDFSDETFLCEYRQKSIFDNGPIIMRRFPETHCRYIRFEILNYQPVVSLREIERRIAFSEIEVLSKSQNIALGASVSISSGLSSSQTKLAQITDGLNYYGAILPIRVWMNQLALRHDLERERPLVDSELKRRYARQQINLRRMGWLVALVVAGALIGILTERLFYLQKMAKMRTRFAADLHDELGANLHTIALLSDAATIAQNSTEEWQMLHKRIRRVAGRTGAAIRNFSNIVNAEDLYEGLVEDMERTSRRILAKLEHSLEIDGEEFFEHLRGNTQVDLFLFYKESLMNICRHSDATQARTELHGSPREVTLTISDNGKGFAEKDVPKALKRRARLLKAKLTVEENPAGGTTVCLRFPLRRGFWRRIF